MVQFYVREYTKTTNGRLNIIEMLLGAILRILYGTFGTITPSEEFLCTCAGIFATNGLFFLVSSIMSVTTALMLPRQFYYTLFHLVAAVCYISGGVAAIGNSSIIDGIVAIVCGVLHLAQFIYSLIKNW
ncbi:uncharacterized protein LOC119187404 [Rhipicephalus microplus]|uniref:uncharacterized protein LOC119187404 n=1 Tax=Rhipicephalus microplus TaxID=6941 RepID=UPI001886C714|nr:uncharacterized protein LOC119187404 [Rhipicephalus microplus]